MTMKKNYHQPIYRASKSPDLAGDIPILLHKNENLPIYRF